jgi:hypothetical protein
MADLFKVGNEFAYDGSGTENLSVITVQIVNATAETITPQLFNTIQAQFVKGAAAGVAGAGAFDPFTAQDFDAANLNSKVYFADNGDLIYQTAAGTKCTISTVESDLNYRDFVTMATFAPKTIEKIRLNVSTLAQIQQGKFTFQRFSDLGKKEVNNYNLTSAFGPNQFQTTVIDIPLVFNVSRNEGLTLNVLTGQTVTIDLNIRS